MICEESEFPFNYFKLEEIFQAYFDCRVNKRNTKDVIKFEEDLENNLIDLYEALNNQTYEIGQSICFVVEEPKYREVWAGQFRDRIVHNLIYNRIFNRFSRSFVYDSYACLPGKGTLFAVNRISKFVRSATENYNNTAYYLQADLKNFFVSINKEVLNNIVLKRINEPILRNLITQVIFHDPTVNPKFNSNVEKFSLVPYHKSLFNSDFYHGLPIGNLTSQFFANVYLNKLDQFVKRKLKVKCYGRYIDDLVMISQNIKYLNYCFNEIKKFVENELDVEFHPNKTIRNTTDKGINFCGQIIKHYRSYIRNRTVRNMKIAFNNSQNKSPEYWKGQINSYLGMLKWCNSYNLRNSLTKDLDLSFDKDILKIKNFHEN